ncbi:MAG TPA: LLM class flavin-dependent oxidoreductase [Myxococcota bacterium]|nr:LLM class flavin-dependent oxidoreductase [Myxococcota bacterium]
MKFDVFCEIQKASGDAASARADHERELFRETREQAMLADELGFRCWWEVEHHGAVEFSWSSAPEVFLAYLSQHTRRIHLGHAGVLAPFRINHPLRVAERAALLDVISGGRLELGLARSGGNEWDTFGVDPATSRAQLVEAMRMIPQMWTQDAFRWKSEHIEIPERNVIPKPLQSPHPPLWQTCGSPESFHLAGTLGVGALGTTLLTPLGQMESLQREYRRGLRECTDPAGKFVNAQSAVFTFVHVRDSQKEAIESGASAAACWYVNTAPRVFNAPAEIWYGQIRGGFLANDPAATRSLASGGGAAAAAIPQEVPVVALLKRLAAGERVSNEEIFETLDPLPSVIVGDVASCRRKIEAYADIGVDRLMCLLQFGALPHESILRSLRTIGEELIPVYDR